MRPYVKPELFCETFELSQHIAACGIDVGYKSTDECNPKFDSDFWGMEATVFSGNPIKCSIDISVVEAYCYTSGTNEAGRLFNS